MCNKGRRIRSAGVDGNADYGVLVLIVPVAFVPRDRDTAREVSVPLWWSWISFVWIEATEGIDQVFYDGPGESEFVRKILMPKLL